MGPAISMGLAVIVLMISVAHHRESEGRREVIAGLRKSNASLIAKSTRDALTGLYTRAYLTEHLADLLRRGTPGGLIMIDLDHFKRINDCHGHDGGDAVLRAVAMAMQRSVRQSDIVARYGGEEFCVLLPGAPEGYAHELAERIRVEIEGMGYRGLPGLTVTASLGVCDAGTHGHATPDAALACADVGMYRAKEAGRNRVTPDRPGMLTLL